MSAHTDRLLRLMVENGVTNTAVLERLNAVPLGEEMRGVDSLVVF